MLAEDALDGDELGPVLVQPLLQALLDGEEAVTEVGVHGGADDTDAEHGERPARDPFDDAHTAPGQPGIHPQYAHRAPPSADSLSCLCRLSVATDNAAHRRPARRRADGLSRRPVRSAWRRRQASTFSMISSLTSKLAKTFWTSSLSSSASISLKIFLAPSSSSSTWTDGTKLESAES